MKPIPGSRSEQIDEWLSQLADQDVRFRVDGDRLHVNAPKGTLTPELQAELVRRKAEILAFLRQAEGRSSLLHTPIELVPRDGPLPLSFAQQRLWFLDQLEPDSTAYNLSSAYRLTGRLDRAALQRSVDDLVRRHESLRTTFVALDGEPRQVTAPVARVPVEMVDLQHLAAADDRESEAQRLVTEAVGRPFDLSEDLLFRVLLLRLGDEEHILSLVIHHIISDGWSQGILWWELMVLYRAHVHGERPPLAELPIQYADYAAWQRVWLQGDVLDDQLAYWQERLAGAPVTELPTDRPRPAVHGFAGARHPLNLPPRVREGLEAVSRRDGSQESTLFMTLLAAFQLLLSRYTGQEDIVVGSPIANRTLAETEGLIGFFVNTLVLRTDLGGDPTFRELLGRVREVCLGAFAHQDLPFEKLVEVLQPERHLSRTPLFQVAFALQNAPRRAVDLAELAARPFGSQPVTVRFDLECHLWETARGLGGVLVYNTDLFDAATIARMAGHYQTLLEAVVENPDRRLSDLPLLTAAERRQVLEWNDTRTDYPGDRCVHRLVEAQAERSPEAVAVVFGDQQLTYHELNRRANQLAWHLQALGVGPDVLVGLSMERSLEMVVAMLGVLKAGGAYVPLDPDYPRERLAFMQEDTRAPVLLTQRALAQRLPQRWDHVVCLDADWPEISRRPEGNPAGGAAAENLAYVIYTSGSTGRPKGVAVCHQAITRLVCNTDYVQLAPGDRVAQASTSSFDAVTFEVWGALVNGACIVGVPREVALSAETLAACLEEQRVTALFLTTALFNQLAATWPAAFRPLEHLLFGGEAVDPRWVREVLDPRHGFSGRLLHVYGPTESTTFTTWYPVQRVEEGAITVPIGRPIANTQVYLLDKRLRPVPVGIPGELYIGGDGLARGYLYRPELTAERFVPSPSGDGARLYRTGDLARYRPDGAIEFLGRFDYQVKLRGFRIELAEIEVVLGEHPGLSQAVVAVVEGEDGGSDKRLVACVVPTQGRGKVPTLRRNHAIGEGEPTAEELRAFLKERLPDFMIPSAFVRLEALPLTPPGKVDRPALAALLKTAQHTAGVEREHLAPRTPMEARLVEIWADVLRLDVSQVGVLDNFFELGGHSLLGIRLFARIEQELGLKLPVAALFQWPTVAELAELTRRKIDPSAWSALVTIRGEGTRPPLFLVHGFGGGVIGYAELARLLGPEQPVYGLQARGLDGRRPPHGRTEEMASYYLEAVRSIQPAGPYYLGGYCYGAVVAFEMARQLNEQGEKVELLAVLEGYAPGRGEATAPLPRWRVLVRFLANLPFWLRDMVTRPGVAGRLAARLRGQLGTMGRRNGITTSPREWDDAVAQNTLAAIVGDPSALSEGHRRVMLAHLKAMRRYWPPAYPGKLTLFRARGLTLRRSHDPEMGWGRLAAGGVELRMIPGAHYNILEKPHVEGLAEQLRECLARTAPSSPTGLDTMEQR